MHFKKYIFLIVQKEKENQTGFTSFFKTPGYGETPTLVQIFRSL